MTATDDAPTGASSPPGATDGVPDRASLVLLTLILVAAVANLNLAVANVALPDIGEAFDSSQTTLDLIAVGYSLGLAASVLWFGALGDRYGRKTMILLGMILAVPASLVAGFAPSDTVLFGARVVSGLSAGPILSLPVRILPPEARATGMGLFFALFYLMVVLGPWIAGHAAGAVGTARIAFDLGEHEFPEVSGEDRVQQLIDDVGAVYELGLGQKLRVAANVRDQNRCAFSHCPPSSKVCGRGLGRGRAGGDC